MKRTLFKSLLLSGALLLAACGGAVRKIGPVRPVEFDRHGWSGADLVLQVGNASSHDLRLHSAEIVFSYDGATVGTATLIREAVAPKRSLDRIVTRWRLRVEDPAAALLIQKRIEAHEYDRIAVSYTLRIRFGAAGKTFSAAEVPLSIFLATFEPIIDIEP